MYQYKFILLLSLFLSTFYNFTFIKNILNTYTFQGLNIVYVLSIFIVLTTLNIFLFSLFSSKYSTKILAILTVLISSFTAYFMDTYSVVIDSEMIRNSMQTNLNESLDLFSYKLLLYVVFLGVLPSVFIYKLKIEYRNFKYELIQKIKYTSLSLVLILLIITAFSKFYSSFFREHKPLRYSANPTYWIYSIGKYISKTYSTEKIILQKQGLDAKIVESKNEKKELTILIVGEAVRADRFSLNGYKRETNPLLEKQKDLINFSNMYSCGTATAISVPCMFSIFTKDEYNYKKGISNENVLDILNRTGVNILWRDNNSDSKGVALRVPYEDFKTNKTNPICDNTECRDIGMISGLDKYIKKDKDTLIILHMMGNHGPAYYKRYPKEFEKFKPVCKSSQLENCTQQEVNNAYDNAVLYTDYFLSKTIDFLKPYSKEFETSMIYISDHGESLGENSIYLHGLPYFIAPDSQKHIASFMWLGSLKDDYNIEKLKKSKDNNLSQDNLFHSLLGMFEVDTKLYNKNLDILSKSRKDIED